MTHHFLCRDETKGPVIIYDWGGPGSNDFSQEFSPFYSSPHFNKKHSVSKLAVNVNDLNVPPKF